MQAVDGMQTARASWTRPRLVIYGIAESLTGWWGWSWGRWNWKFKHKGKKYGCGDTPYRGYADCVLS